MRALRESQGLTVENAESAVAELREVRWLS